MGNIVFKKDNFICFRAGTNIILFNTDKEFENGHTHLKSIKAAYDAVTFCTLGKIPKNSRNYYLISLQRLSTSQEYIDRIQELMDVRSQKGKTLGYRNDTGKRGTR